MTLLVGTGVGNSSIQQVFSLGSSFYLLTVGDTLISADSTAGLGKVVVNGSGFTWTSSVVNGSTFYQLTGGTITSVDYTNGPSHQTWTGFSVPAASAFNALLDYNAFNNLFFSGDDTFNWTPASTSNGSTLGGYDGNDTFNISNWTFAIDPIDGGNGNDTVNVSGGLGTNINFNSAADLFNSTTSSNFSVTNVETINLAAGSNYIIDASTNIVASGSTLTVNASALGPSNIFVFDTDTYFPAAALAGNLVLLGGAGDDVFSGGIGSNVFNGGGGNDTVVFTRPGPQAVTGVTANLGIAGAQNFGTGWGTGTFISIENLIGSGGDDSLTGDANDNLLTGRGGNDALDGGAGYDTAVYKGLKSDYTISYSGHTITISGNGPDGTDTLTNVEFAQFSDQTIRIGGPVVASQSTRVAANQIITLANLTAVSDLTNYAITAYQLWDSNSDPNSGHFVINNVTQQAGKVINVTAAQLAQTSFVTGTADDNLQIRAIDANNIWSAVDNAAWSPFSIGPTVNNLPVITASNISPLPNQQHFQTIALSSLISTSDLDGDTITEYQLWDGSRDPASGHFVVNNLVQAAGTVIDISAAQLAQTSFVTGLFNDNLQIRARDSHLGWSAADNAVWTRFSTFLYESAPILTGGARSLVAGHTVSVNNMFNQADTDGDPITEYQLWDGTGDPNSGYFVVNGQVQAAGTVIDLTPAQYAQTVFVVGTVGDNLQVRASDGALWSAPDTGAWTPINVLPTPNHPPTVTPNTVVASRNQTFLLTGLVTVSDAESDPITKYQLWDSTSDPLSGHFAINGVAQNARTVIDITAAQLAQTTFVTGRASDNLQVRAFDGYNWSAADNAAWSPFTLSVTNALPVVAVANLHVSANQVVTSSNLATVTDADGDTITRYQLWDGATDPGSGHFVVNNVVQAAGTVIDITAAQWAQTTFMAGSTASDRLEIRAFDGVNWSAPDNGPWSLLTVSPPINNPPIMVTHTVNASHFQTLQPSDLFSVSDPDGDTITKYQLWDGGRDPNSGHFVVNGQVKAAGTIIDVTAAEMAQTVFVTGQVNDSIEIRAFDGNLWSAPNTGSWAPFTVTVPANNAPVVHPFFSFVQHDRLVSMATLWDSIQDPDGDPIVRYQLWDGTRDPNSGHFVVNGVDQPAGTVIDLNAAQFSQTSFMTGNSVADSLQLRIFDGISWSAADNVPWAPTSMFVGENYPPSVFAQVSPNVSASPNQVLQLSGLVGYDDLNGDPATRYQLWDSTADPLSGHFEVGGVAKSAGTVIDVTAAQWAQTTFVAGASGHNDSFEVRAFDGWKWSAPDSGPWSVFHINAS